MHSCMKQSKNVITIYHKMHANKLSAVIKFADFHVLAIWTEFQSEFHQIYKLVSNFSEGKNFDQNWSKILHYFFKLSVHLLLIMCFLTYGSTNETCMFLTII